jgi:hypothetical protein
MDCSAAQQHWQQQQLPRSQPAYHQEAAVDCGSSSAVVHIVVSVMMQTAAGQPAGGAHAPAVSLHACARDTLCCAVLCRNNTSDYYVNNKKMNVKEVTTLLKSKGIDLDNNRFLILQVRAASNATHWCTVILSL